VNVMEAAVGGSLDWPLVIQIIIVTVLLYGLFIVGKGIRRKELDADAQRTIALQHAENEALRGATERLESELAKAQETNDKLDSHLVELTKANHDLTALIMGERVSDAMLKAMNDQSNRVIASMQVMFAEQLARALVHVGALERRSEDRPFTHQERRDAVDE